MTTRPTYKRALAFAVCLLLVAALIAGAGSVAWINVDHRHAAQRGFIVDHHSQFAERPLAMLAPLWLSNRRAAPLGPLADAFQMLEGNGLLRVFSLLDKHLADAVVGVALELPLPTRALFQATFGRPGADRLKGSPSGIVPLAGLFYPLSAMTFTVRISGQFDDTQVDAQVVSEIIFRLSWYVTCCQKEKPPLRIGKVAFPLLKPEKTGYVVIADVGYLFPPVQSPDGYNLFGGVVAKNPTIVGNRGVFAEYPLRFLVLLVGVRHFANAAYDHLSSQAVLLFQLVVQRLLNLDLIERLILPSPLRNLLTGSVCPLQRGEQQMLLRISGFKKNFGGQLHVANVLNINQMRKRNLVFSLSAYYIAGTLSLPPLKGVGFLSALS